MYSVDIFFIKNNKMYIFERKLTRLENLPNNYSEKKYLIIFKLSRTVKTLP